MRTIVLDTNCLLAILPSVSPYHNVWTGILKGDNNILKTIDFPKIEITRLQDFARMYSYSS